MTPVQRRALRMLRSDAYARYRPGSLNWYHPRHRPGNLYIDDRTVTALRRDGLVETDRWGRLSLTEKGREAAR